MVITDSTAHVKGTINCHGVLHGQLAKCASRGRRVYWLCVLHHEA